ncbi:OTU domain-containing protein [Trichonephila inaurata madagascariensis]|uniref:OTU domain-containing protein n=1 Tax=Trichonephila inaurata madagascariensis TaxID=2747483 RepID=A0A8X7C6I3_9ARAC|nr:OTU domain-containing protein [Trichonephila inaurata madagascariensis]
MGDDHHEKDICCGIYPGIKPELISPLQKSLHEHNKYIMDFKSAIHSVPKDQKEFKVVINAEKKPFKEGTLMRINEIHHAYDALLYPLMFFLGEDGYQINIPKHHETTKIPLSKAVSFSEFYSYRIMECDGEKKKRKGGFRLPGNQERSGFGKSVYTVHPGNAECCYLHLLS